MYLGKLLSHSYNRFSFAASKNTPMIGRDERFLAYAIAKDTYNNVLPLELGPIVEFKDGLATINVEGVTLHKNKNHNCLIALNSELLWGEFKNFQCKVYIHYIFWTDNYGRLFMEIFQDGFGGLDSPSCEF